MEFLDRRHPEPGVELELIVQPLRAGLLQADAKKVGAGHDRNLARKKARCHAISLLTGR
jgi:hypothetical protein